MTDIFLSYSEKDRETARRVAAVLESVGWTVWWDRRIPAGETWRSVLEKALENMRCMIVLWSANSIASEWVYEEASEGHRQHKLLPALIEAVRPPVGFREIQAADLTDWDGSHDFEGMRMLITDLENLLGKPQPAARRISSQPDKTSAQSADSPSDHHRPYGLANLDSGAPPTQRWSRRGVQGWAAAVALLLVGGVAYLMIPSSQESAVNEPQAHGTSRRNPGRTLLSPVELPTTLPAQEVAASPVATPHTLARTSADKRGEVTRAARSRCADLLARIQLGETLSDDAQAVYQKECRQ